MSEPIKESEPSVPSKLTSVEVYSKKDKVKALVEVVIVRFVVYALIARLVLFLIYGAIDTTNIFAPYIIGALWFLIPLLIIMVFKRKPKSYGLSKENWHTGVDVGLKTFVILLIPMFGFLITSFFGWSYLEPAGSLVLTSCFSIALCLVLIQLSKRENFSDKDVRPITHRNNLIVIILLLSFPIILAFFFRKFTVTLVSVILWQFIFSGFGEEFFFRGYIQSRLNEGFGKPYIIKGIQYGPGLIITAVIFAVTHIMSTGDIWVGNFTFAWWWGAFTFVGGLIFGFLREKTDSIVASGVAHGMDAVGEGLGLLFS